MLVVHIILQWQLQVLPRLRLVRFTVNNALKVLALHVGRQVNARMEGIVRILIPKTLIAVVHNLPKHRSGHLHRLRADFSFPPGPAGASRREPCARHAT